jgi:hypothetical protein
VSESSVIREFLVALGFKTDEAALKKFESGIDKATKAVFGLAAAVETTAVAVSVGVARFASNLEALYFASIKANSAATNLKAYERTLQNFGVSANEALGSVQGLARFLRNNPGGEGVLEGLLGGVGEHTRDVNGRLRDTTDLMLGLGKVFRGQEYYLAKQFADQFGISEDTLRAMRSGDFEKEVARMREQMGNAGFEKASKDAHAFMMDLRDLGTQLELFGLQVYEALSKRLGVNLHDVVDWLKKNGPLLAERVAEILSKLLDFAERIGHAVMWLVDKFIELDKATDGWSTRILAAVAIMKVFGGFEILSGILKLVGAFGSLTTGIAGANATSSLLLTTLGAIGAAVAGWKIGEMLNEHISEETKNKIGKTIARVLGMFGNRDANEALAMDDPVQFYVDRGWTKEQAAGIVANLKAESNLNPYASGDHGKAYGVAQWHADRQDAFKKWAGHDIHQSDMLEQLDFVDFELKRGAERRAGELLRAAQNAREASDVMTRYYERPAAVNAESEKRAGAAVHIAQETNINIHGVSDPAAAGREVESKQGRVNSELTRNFQVAVQ